MNTHKQPFLGAALLILASCMVACERGEPDPISSSPDPEVVERLAASMGCVFPIVSEDSKGCVFFPDPAWGLTAAHVVDDIPEAATIAFSIEGQQAPLNIRLDAPPGAFDDERAEESDWCVLRVVPGRVRTEGDTETSPAPSPAPSDALSDALIDGVIDGVIDACYTPIDATYTPKLGEALYSIGLLAPDFKSYDETGELRVMRLAASEPAPNEPESDALLWMRWPHEFAPRGFSGGPVFADVDGEFRIIGLNIQSVRQGDRWWLLARRITPDMIEFIASPPP